MRTLTLIPLFLFSACGYSDRHGVPVYVSDGIPVAAVYPDEPPEVPDSDDSCSCGCTEESQGFDACDYGMEEL